MDEFENDGFDVLTLQTEEDWEMATSVPDVEDFLPLPLEDELNAYDFED